MNTNDSKIVSLEDEMNASKLCKSLLDETLRRGAQKLLKEAIEKKIRLLSKGQIPASGRMGRFFCYRKAYFRWLCGHFHALRDYFRPFRGHFHLFRAHFRGLRGRFRNTSHFLFLQNNRICGDCTIS